jgi:uncharacterized protein (TIGR00255 family)
MTISSMTGFARTDGAADGLKWTWEARSVNGRGLDVRLRVPPGFEALEIPAREAASKLLSRGNVTATLSLERQNGSATVRLNEALLADIIKAAKRVAELSGSAPPDAATLIAIKGVLETADATVEDQDVRAARERKLLSSFESALGKLSESRRAEGSKLKAVLLDQMVQIEKIAAEVRASPSRSAAAIRARLKDNVARLLEASETFDPDRLHQEAVLVATRADVEEELARLKAHVAAVREILDEPGAVGRKLDFLAQEFNREANTLCSKANAVDITRLGLALKSVIDQFREQVQNVE